MKQVFTCALCVVLFASMISADAFALQPADLSPPRGSAPVGRLIEKLGSGPEALVAVRLRDKSVVSGYVAQATADSFLVVDPDSGETNAIPYAQVSRLQGYNLVTGTEVRHGVGVRAKLARMLSYLAPVKPATTNNFSGRNTLIIGIVVGIIIAVVLAKTL